tara:strand:+ start:2215 stop:2421 length:207 start_codon:yes stop_codon:yes gene_type:complete
MAKRVEHVAALLDHGKELSSVRRSLIAAELKWHRDLAHRAKLWLDGEDGKDSADDLLEELAGADPDAD